MPRGAKEQCLFLVLVVLLMSSNGFCQDLDQEESSGPPKGIEEESIAYILKKKGSKGLQEAERKAAQTKMEAEAEQVKAEKIIKEAPKKEKTPVEPVKVYKEEERPVVVTPYTTTEELFLAPQVSELRRSFKTTEPMYFGWKDVEEQQLFEELARRDEERHYRAVKIYEAKPWWKDLLEAGSGYAQYKQFFYTNYFNTRKNFHMWTENPIMGLRFARRGVLSIDSNYFTGFEFLTRATPKVSMDPHVIKSHGGQIRLLYRPSGRYSASVSNNLRVSNKINGTEGGAKSVQVGNSNLNNNFGSELRYFFTPSDILDVTFAYDYSRSRSNSALRISRGYQPKITYTHSLGSRVLLRGHVTGDYLKTVRPAAAPTSTASGNATTRFSQMRGEPGVGGTFVVTRRLVVDMDYARQRLQFRGSRKHSFGDRVNLKFNHRLAKRLTHSYVFSLSTVESKRNAVSTVTTTKDSSFENAILSAQYNYKISPQTGLSLTLEYSRSVTSDTPNNRKKVSIELTRKIARTRFDLVLNYTFDRNDGDLPSTYLAHIVSIACKYNFGADRGDG